jgi:segregation and condensation protein B
VGYLSSEKSKRRLSQAALETLSIIAYKQPLTKPELESIRGVNSDYILNTLLEKNLITISGRAETVGRPLLYSTTSEFLKYFGLNKLSDLPKPREMEEIMNDEDFIEQKRKIMIILSKTFWRMSRGKKREMLTRIINIFQTWASSRRKAEIYTPG